MFPTAAVGLQMRRLTDVKTHYALPTAVWNSFVAQAGDPGEDLKLLCALPSTVVSVALAQARLPDGSPLSAVQASQVGLVYSLTRRILHAQAGGDWDAWKEAAPFGDATPVTPSEPAPQVPATDRKLKMTNILDQGDDGDFTVEGEEAKAKWYANYLRVMGGWPAQEEEPSIEQLSALSRRLNVQNIAPYTDFAIFVPFGQKVARASKYRTYVLTAGGYTVKELPGPSSFLQWRAAYRVLKSSLIMLDSVGLANLHGYEMVVERLSRLYPSCWHLVVQADELARSSHSNRLRSQVMMDIRAGKDPPLSWDDKRPWDWVFGALIADSEFWHTQVHAPALAWMANGSRGTPKTPAELVAADYMQGGLDAITTPTEPLRNKPARASRSRNRTRARRDARKKKLAEDKAELQRLRTKDNHAGDKKNQGAQQKCYSWNNGNGPCADSQPGQQCVGKVRRLTILPKCQGQVRAHGAGDSSGRSRSPRRNRTLCSKSKAGPNRSKDYEDPHESGSDDLHTKMKESKTLEEYLSLRTFVFVHHFAGPEDPLTKAMQREARNYGIKLKAYSVEKESGSGDLLADRPYQDHLLWARRGHIDAYHAGFPCGTFSRLRHRPRPGHPTPVRTKSEPYGRSCNTKAQQEDCDRGTVMASRAITMAKTVANRKKGGKIKSISTLENPPPSNLEDHLSAWELPEMREFLGDPKVYVSRFDTCAYQSKVPLGSRILKPQQFAGSMIGIKELGRSCPCGGDAKHEPVIGRERSKASGTYPDELCEQYAKLAITQLYLMGKEEFLTYKKERLQKSIDQHKSKSSPSSQSQVKSEGSEDSSSPKPASAHKKAKSEAVEEEPDYDASSSASACTPSKKTKDTSSDEDRSKAPALKAETMHTWVGSDGKFGMLKSRQIKGHEDEAAYVGGMRDPYKAAQSNPTLMSLGLRVRAAWETFMRQYPEASKVAETYGTPACEFNGKLVVAEWKSRLKKVVGARAPASLNIRERLQYKSPLDAEIIQAWAEKANDKETEVPKWIRGGAPLGIEREIKCCGIFPPSTAEDPYAIAEAELMDAQAQLSRGEVLNYKSVSEDLTNARIELERYKAEGYTVELTKEEVLNTMGHGTISRLGLIVKEKPSGIKRRIIIDLRRSGGNTKASLPEKLVLPRPKDALGSARNIHDVQHFAVAKGPIAREMVVIDISDAFMSLGVHPDEVPHTLAPHVDQDGYYAFVALLFGFKTAPLLWSRVASLHARLLQSLVEGHEGQHQVYLDDALWFLQGDLSTRNMILSMLLHTSAALGFKLSLSKGERSCQVTWIGVRLTLTEDSLIMGLPEKYTEELVQLLQSWEGRGMAPIKELRQAAGKASWLAGILPRARWIVSIFYRVLHSRLADIKSGAEDRRREGRSDTRDKSHLFAVKQLEQPRKWLIAYLRAATEKPAKKYRLDTKKYPSATIVTDASPAGLGGILLINNRVIRAFASPVTEEDAKAMDFQLGESSSQGIVETMAVLVALKHWTKEISACNLTLHVQSDSLVALAITQKLSNSSPALNF
eukprot:s1995_g7.t1